MSRLTVISYCTITEENGNFYLNDKIGTVIDGLAPHFQEVFFIGGYADKSNRTFYKDGRSIYRYKFKQPNIRIIFAGKGDARSPWRKSLALIKNSMVFWKYINESDIVFAYMPGYSGYISHLLCRVSRKPYFLYFGSDWQEVARYNADWKGLGKLIYPIYVWFSRLAERKAARHARFTVVHGKKLIDKFKDCSDTVVETVPMISINKEDMFFRIDTCNQQPIRLLYVGAIIPRKGIEYLIKAIALVLEEGHNIRLSLVGGEDENYGTQMRNLVKDLGITDYVNFEGYITDKQKLLEFYRTSDIFILPSLGEGFPRVLYEAMSQGVPIITSRIDTIWEVLKEENIVLFVTPQSAEEIACAISYVSENKDFRTEVIQAGYRFVRNRIGRTLAQQLLALLQRKTDIRLAKPGVEK